MTLRGTLYGVRSHTHLGDSIITAGAVRNVKAARPDLRFQYVGWCREIWANNPDTENPAPGEIVTLLPLIDYGRVEEEQRASRGNVVEAFTRSLCEALGIPMVPISTRVPVAYLTDEEKERSAEWSDCILLNANGQTVSFSKSYPHWQEVVDRLAGEFRIVQVGSNERRNLSPDLTGVEDWRGKTENVRDLLCMVAGCRGVVSPPSGIVNIAAAFGTAGVVVNGARELDALTDYPNMEHVSIAWLNCGAGKGRGWACVSLTENALRRCRQVETWSWKKYAACMKAVEPESIAEAARRAFA